MAYRVNIEAGVWGDSAYEVVAKVMGWQYAEFAIGFVAKLWAESQKAGISEATTEQLNEFVGLKLDEALWVKALQRGKVVTEVGPNRYKIRGNQEQIDGIVEYKKKKQEAGQKRAEGAQRNAQGQFVKGEPSHDHNITSSDPAVVDVLVEQKATAHQPITITSTSTNTIPSTNTKARVSIASQSSEKPSKRLPAEKKANALIARYCELWKAAYGGPPDITGKDAGIARRLARGLTTNRILELLDAYFQMPDSWVVQAAHSLDVFERKLKEIGRFVSTGQVVTRTSAAKVDQDVHWQQRNRAVEKELMKQNPGIFEDTQQKLIGGSE